MDFFANNAVLFVLLFGLMGTAWAIHMQRDRKFLFLIMGVSFLYFGFFRIGCVCSPGSVQNVLDSLINRTPLSITILFIFLLPIIASFFWGRVFCSGLCPLGILQDIISAVRIKLPRPLVHILRMGPPLFLAYVIVNLVSGGGFVLCKMDPYITVFRLNFTAEFFWYSIIMIAISMVVYRPFCSFLCPYGLILGWAGKFTQRSIVTASTSCITCNFCADACPVDAIEYGDKKLKEPTKKSWTVRDTILVVLIPVWLLGFGLIGKEIATATAPVKSEITKLEKSVESLSETIEKKKAKPGKVTGMEKLEKKYETKLVELDEKLSALAGVQKGGWIIGILLGLYWGISLLIHSRKAAVKDTHVDMANCVVCGRCNNYCTTERKVANAGNLNTACGHLAHRKELPQWGIGLLKVAAVVGVLMFVSSFIILRGTMHEIDSLQTPQKEVAELKKGIRKNPTDKTLYAVFMEKQEYLDKTTLQLHDTKEKATLFTIIGMFLFAISMKYLMSKREYKDVLQRLKKYRSDAPVRDEQIVIWGTVVVGVIIIVVKLLF